MLGNTIFYTKHSHLIEATQSTNIYEVFEWWILDNQRIIVQHSIEGENLSDTDDISYQFEISDQDYNALMLLISDALPHICSNRINAFSWWEMQACDAGGAISCRFEGSYLNNHTLQQLTNILIKYAPTEHAKQLFELLSVFAPPPKKEVKIKTRTTSMHNAKEIRGYHTESKLSKILKSCCNILLIGLCFIGALSYGKDFVWRGFSYDDSLTRYIGIIFVLTLALPVFYLLFFNSKSKYKNYFGLIAAGLVLIRQVFCLKRELNVSSLACLVASGSFFLIFLFTMYIHAQRSRPFIMLSSIVPIIFSIVGIIEMHTGITHNYVPLAVISPIFIVFCHCYLIINTSTAE